MRLGDAMAIRIAGDECREPAVGEPTASRAAAETEISNGRTDEMIGLGVNQLRSGLGFLRADFLARLSFEVKQSEDF